MSKTPLSFCWLVRRFSRVLLSFLALPVVFASPPHRLMDHDMYSAHGLRGKVYICLNPLADGGDTPSSSTLDGWLPIFDTLHGERYPLGRCPLFAPFPIPQFPNSPIPQFPNSPITTHTQSKSKSKKQSSSLP